MFSVKRVYDKILVFGGSARKNLPVTAGHRCSIPGFGRSLEKEMATHSSILAWDYEILWTEEPGYAKMTLFVFFEVGIIQAPGDWLGSLPSPFLYSSEHMTTPL